MLKRVAGVAHPSVLGALAPQAGRNEQVEADSEKRGWLCHVAAVRGWIHRASRLRLHTRCRDGKGDGRVRKGGPQVLETLAQAHRAETCCIGRSSTAILTTNLRVP